MALSTSFGGGSSSGSSFNPSPGAWAPWNPGYSYPGYAMFGGSGGTSTPTASGSPQLTPVSPTIDPKLEANTLYGKPIILSALGYARIGATGAPLVGPYINAGVVDFIVSFGFAVPITGNRKIYKIFLDNELAWSSATGWDGSGALPGDSTFHAEVFSIEFRPGTLTQAVLSLETSKFGASANAYRPEMVLQITGLPYARFMANSGKPVPYVSAEIGDVTDGADPFDFINLGLALERIAHSPWAGYSASTFEAVGITDIVDGIIIAENFNVIQICQSITNYYRNIHLLQSDKLRIKDHGAVVTPSIIFDRDTIIGGDGAVSINRAGASTEARESELITIDPDQDYTRVPSIAKRPREPVAVSASVGKSSGTLPVIIDAETRQSLVTLAQYEKENARKRISFRVPIFGYEIEPGDLFAHVDLADGIDNQVMLVEDTSHNGDFTVTIQARAILRCLTYTEADPYLSDVILLMGFNGSFVDESPIGRAMSAVGGATIDTSDPIFGIGSYLGDGSGDAVTADDADNAFKFSGEFTAETFFTLATIDDVAKSLIACWLNVAGGGNWRLIIPQGSGDITFEWATGSSTSVTVAQAVTLLSATRYHVAVDRDASNVVRVYLQGVMLASATIATTIPNAAQRIRVGADGSGASSLDGRIDEPRVTLRARYASDGGFSVPSDPWPRI